MKDNDAANRSTRLAQALAQWQEDARVADLFVGGHHGALGIWLAEVESGAGTKEVRWLYAWVIAAVTGRPGISSTTGSGWQKLGDSAARFRLRRVVLIESPARLTEVATQMLNGVTLGNAAALVGHTVQAPFDALRLGATREDVATRFDAAPVRFLPTESASSAWAEWGRPLSSPSTSQPAFVAALVRLGKADLFADSTTKAPLPGADEFARRALNYLKLETGLDFAETDARRLGNLEWISLPAADAHERSDVHWKTEKAGSSDDARVVAVRVHVAAGHLPAGSPILVRCRVVAAHEPAADVCVQTVVGQDVVFPVEHEITAVLITVWKLDHDRRGHLWFEDQVPLIRQISFAMGLMGLSGSLETDWSAALRTARQSVRTRVDKVRSIQQVHYEGPREAGHWAAWESAQREGEALAQRVFPKKSSARFFPCGWEDGAPGDLSFIEWLRGVTEDSSVASVILTDPFFDDHGVREFLARAKGTQIEYVILTNSQVTSKVDASLPDVGNFDNSLPARAARIVAECSRMREILTRLRFRIVDLRSKRPSRDQLFHDRYLLAFKRGRGLAAGYSLSNSIQGATRKAPLLITPIPEDVLDQVGKYVGRLLEAEHDVVGDAQMVEIMSSKELDRPILGDQQQRPSVARFMALMTGDPALERVSPHELRHILEQRGLVEGDSFAYTGRFEGGPERLSRALEAASPEEFRLLWDAVGDWWAHSHDENPLLATLKVHAGLANGLEQYLESTPEGAVDTREHTSALAHLLRKDLADVLDETRRLLEYGPHLHWVGSYGTKLAARILATLDPSRAVGLAERTWLSIAESQRGNDGSPQVQAAMRVLLPLIDALTDNFRGRRDSRTLEALASSSIAACRAFAVHMAVPEPTTTDIKSALAQLDRLEPRERLEAMAWWVGQLRIVANRNDGLEPEDIRIQRLRLFDEMATTWAVSRGKERLAEVAERLGGPAGGWAESTTREFFDRLVSARRLTWDDVENVWFAQFSERVGRMVADKAGDRYHFYAPVDRQLTEAEAFALIRSSPERRADRQVRVARLRELAEAVLGRPFAQSKSYARWADALEGLAWLKAFAILMRTSGAGLALAPDEDAAWQAELEALNEALVAEPESHADGASRFARELAPR